MTSEEKLWLNELIQRIENIRLKLIGAETFKERYKMDEELKELYQLFLKYFNHELAKDIQHNEDLVKLATSYQDYKTDAPKITTATSKILDDWSRMFPPGGEAGQICKFIDGKWEWVDE